MLIAFHKPFGVLSQFTANDSAYRTLADFGFPPKVYPLGRLDAESEGLLLLSDERGLNARLLHPSRGHVRLYWAQVEGCPTEESLRLLAQGLLVRGHQTLPCRSWILEPQPDVPPRDPPIRYRKFIPTCWLALELSEGKNRQVRRMTATIGYPTLRLIRVRIGRLDLGDLALGKWKLLTGLERASALA